MSSNLEEVSRQATDTEVDASRVYRTLAAAWIWTIYYDNPQSPSQSPNTKKLQLIWDSLPQEPINNAVESFTPRLKRCAKDDNEHFEHSKWLPSGCRCCAALPSFRANAFQRI